MRHFIAYDDYVSFIYLPSKTLELFAPLSYWEVSKIIKIDRSNAYSFTNVIFPKLNFLVLFEPYHIKQSFILE